MPAQILVVDDEPDIQKVIVARLNAVGYSCITADDGEQAVQMALAHNPALIVLDLALPKLSGDEVCRVLRESKNSTTAKIPIILLTARSVASDRLSFKEMGANAYLEKPFKLDELLATIKKLIVSV